MALVEISPDVVSFSGQAPTWHGSLTATDIFRVRNSGKVWIYWKNTNAATRTITVDVPSTIAGQDVPDYTFTVPAQIAASTTGVHAAVTDNGSPQTVTTAITNPTRPAKISATAGGTADDIKAISVTITGTDAKGHVITETLPAFTVDTAGTVTGEFLFATVTSIAIPAHDGTGATTAIGWAAIPGEVVIPPLPAGIVNDDAGNLVFTISTAAGLTYAAIQNQ